MHILYVAICCTYTTILYTRHVRMHIPLSNHSRDRPRCSSCVEYTTVLGSALVKTYTRKAIYSSDVICK